MSPQIAERPTDEEILAFSQQVQDSATENIPLVSSELPLSTLNREYENGNPTFLTKLDNLGSHARVYRTRGDGNCFYRAFAFSLIRQVQSAQTQSSLISRLRETETILESGGFSALVYEDFLNETIEMITDDKLLDAMNQPERSNAVVVFLRFLTSAYMKSNKDAYVPYLEQDQVLDRWAERWVEAIGAEADNIQIHALVMALRVGVDVVHLDGTPGSHANVHSVRPEFEPVEFVVKVLYRPGNLVSFSYH